MTDMTNDEERMAYLLSAKLGKASHEDDMLFLRYMIEKDPELATSILKEINDDGNTSHERK